MSASLRIPVHDPRGDASWQASASCAQADPDLWYPHHSEPAHDAMATCNRCEVVEQCLQWALDHNETEGIWGGTTPQMRREIKPAAPRAATAPTCGQGSGAWAHRKNKEPLCSLCREYVNGIKNRYKRKLREGRAA